VRKRRNPVSRWYRRNERAVLSAAGIVSFVAAWQIGADAGLIDKFFFSSPTDILAAGVAEVQKPRFWEDVKISAIELGSGRSSRSSRACRSASRSGGTAVSRSRSIRGSTSSTRSARRADPTRRPVGRLASR
jgi:hypothetical protein